MDNFPFDREYDPKFAYEWKVISLGDEEFDAEYIPEDEREWLAAGWEVCRDDAGRLIEWRGTRLYRRDRKLNDAAVEKMAWWAREQCAGREHPIQQYDPDEAEIDVISRVQGIGVEELAFWQLSAIFFYFMARILGPKEWLICRYLGVNKAELRDFGKVCGLRFPYHYPKYLAEQHKILLENGGMQIRARSWIKRRGNVSQFPVNRRSAIGLRKIWMRFRR